jgi:hypothetical protein
MKPFFDYRHVAAKLRGGENDGADGLVAKDTDSLLTRSDYCMIELAYRINPIDKIIFRTINARHRPILEPRVRGKRRNGKILKPWLKDLKARKRFFGKPASGKISLPLFQNNRNSSGNSSSGWTTR